MIYLVTFWKVP